MKLTVKEMSEALVNRESNTVLDGLTLGEIEEKIQGMPIEKTDLALLTLLVKDYQKISRELLEQTTYMEEMTDVDPVLKISNRHSILKVIKREWEGSKRYHSPTSLIMFSVDALEEKALDEEEKQRIYIDLAGIINKSTRLTDTFGRIDEDQFIIVVPTTNNIQATWLSGKLSESIDGYDFGLASKVSCSFGVADSSDSMDPEDWLQITEDAYNRAVEMGGKTVIDYETIILK